MQVETALFFETPAEIYSRVFRQLHPRTPPPHVMLEFKKYANANSRITLSAGTLAVSVSDLLQSAPAPVHEALANILISKLYRMKPPAPAVAVYRRYLGRADMRHSIGAVKRQRGRKHLRAARGAHYDLRAVFDELNFQFFGGLMAAPRLGWSLRASRTTLGHYDPSHNAIVLSSILDSAEAPEIAVRYVMYHEILHLRYPAEHRAGRRCIHTREFKAAEKQFPRHSEAKSALREFVQKSRKQMETGSKAR